MKPGVVGALLLAACTLAGAASYEERERDWRNGAIVYQVLVDRFAPSANVDAKRALYAPPKRLRDWSENPMSGPYLPELKLGAQELDFWGGDLASTAARLDHVQGLGAEVLYLNPIHLAFTNHKYDALDYKAISPEYGTREDFKRLAAETHRRGMKLVLDGVFNHMGRNAPIFQDAMASTKSRWRDWFAIGPQYEGGARVWAGYQNHPELNLDNPAVRRYLYEAPDSVVRGYLRDGADGWRLDTAYELGLRYLADLTRAAHAEKPGSLVVGEIVNYPDRWLRSIDAVMNFSMRQILFGMAEGRLDATTASRMADRLVRDSGIEPMLKSWLVVDNHDTPRVATLLPDPGLRRVVQALQFTLPGAPNIYYGAEIGMTGGPDPESRGPMRWDWVNERNPELRWMRRLVDLHKTNRALRVGDYRNVEAQRVWAFERHTDRVLETRIVVANPGPETVHERLMIANAGLMAETPMIDLLGDDPKAVVGSFGPGFVDVEVPARTVMVLKPEPKPQGGYSRYKNVR